MEEVAPVADHGPQATADEAAFLCKEILRVGDGTPEVTFGSLARDDEVTQQFEALLGTLKAARRRGLLFFKGELLLMGQHDDIPITLTSSGQEAALGRAAPAAQDGPAADIAEELAAPTLVIGMPEAGGGSPVVPPPGSAPSDEDRTGAASWKVDMTYIDHRTADVARMEGRRSMTSGGDTAVGVPGVSTSAQLKKEDGKWAVDMSYINHRTSVVENLDGRKAVSSDTAPSDGAAVVAGSVAASATVKVEDGKWKVDTSYINHRTAEVENLEGKQNVSSGDVSTAGAGGPATVASATVKKVDGAWKVDTAYIGYRTGDTANLTRKEEKMEHAEYADPRENKFPYEDLKGVGNRPDQVDPKSKEMYLAEDEFQVVFGMSLDAFGKLPKWRQQNLKKAKDVF